MEELRKIMERFYCTAAESNGDSYIIHGLRMACFGAAEMLIAQSPAESWGAIYALYESYSEKFNKL